ncbi:hypothetical protein LVV83_01135 [Pseudomonas sp. LM20]|uniref:hypothetical protein n=1 Tax=Pseudomonas sp. LM20 TaxID=2899116 RepID=UPI001F3C851A|nr:hypothetical protein [Pseudomonas sp. LM20]MCE5985637.1 hypothetical protein [Pseudomonas sp. LM20]
MTSGVPGEIMDRLVKEQHERSCRVVDMLSREATLVSEIASMRAQVKLARQEDHAGRQALDTQWLRRINYAIIMTKKELAGLRVDRGLAQYQQKEERRKLTLLTQLSEQALFMRHAKRLLSKKVYEEVRAAVRSEVSMVIPLIPELEVEDCS